MNVDIKLTEGARATLNKLQTLPEWGLRAVAKGLKSENQMTVGHIQQAHLTGRGPFAVAEHKLGVRSGRLRGALWATEPTVEGQVVTSAIGDNVVYAAIHEFGGRIVRKPHTGKVRLRTDRAGNLARQTWHGNLAVFARKGHKLAKEVEYKSEGYVIDMPERAPVRTGIRERLADYGRGISRELVRAWAENKT